MRRLLHKSAVDRRGFTLVETLVSLAIVTGLFAVVFLLMGQARFLFYGTGAGVELRNGLRVAGEKAAEELRYSGYDAAGRAQFTVLDNSGVDESDVIRFAIPVRCAATAPLLHRDINCDGYCDDDGAYDGHGGLAADCGGQFIHWGAPLTWGCDEASCMDQNNSCADSEYRYVEYSLDNGHQLVRNVLSSDLTIMGSQVLAGNIVGFQVSVSGNVLNFTLNAEKQTEVGTRETADYSQDVFFDNYGGA